MNSLERFQPVIILLAVGIGLLIGGVDIIQSGADHFIIPFLMLMLYGLFLLMPLKRVFTSFKKWKFVLTSLVINFLWTPAIAYLIGMLFLSEHPLLWIGFIMLTVTPCTDWYLVFTGIAKGDTVLSTSMLPVNLLLQVILLPIYLHLFFGVEESMGLPLHTIFGSILIIIGIPFALAIFTRRLVKSGGRVAQFFEQANVLFLGVAIAAMFASERTSLIENLDVVLLLLIPLLVFFIINFIAGSTASRFLHFSKSESVSLIIMVLARNSPLALAIAIAAFPDQPLIALSLVIGPIIELPVLGLVSRLLISYK
ncbi:arsenic resistance protein [Salinicoccus hispanicus]|uniref:Arsenic resistance protein n=1 Tax=Salinicoccus hispanicus TaxID=157225 RepID=A0A6N8U8B6_9STAP|nr:bile acid:sodium symporter [Salinicoccus hispanicus]MXQ51909.1 arsenic resistance protein [Salinicoccus hispanicus]